MKKFISIFVILFSIIINSPLSAQDLNVRNESNNSQSESTLTSTEQDDLYENDRPAVVQDSRLLDVEFIQHTQSPSNKKAKFTMRIKSNVTSDRIQFKWVIKGDSNVVNENELTGTRSFQEGKTYDISITILPVGQGITEVYGEVEVFGAESDVLATVRKNFAANANSEILPLTDAYNQAKLINTVKTIILLIVLVVGGALGGVFGFKKFVDWYKKDEQAEYDKKVQQQIVSNNN